MNIIAQGLNAVVRFLRPDVDAIIATFIKAQKKLETFIDREDAKLASGAKAIVSLTQQQLYGNSVVNRAYRVIHRLDQLTA